MIDSCKILTLDKFITCLCEQDYSVLGEGTEGERLIAWQKIRTEYITLMEDHALIQAETFRTEILFWQLQYQSVVASVNLLLKWRDENVLNGLREKGYIFEYSQKDTDAYHKDLKMVLSQAKSMLTHIANTQHELETLAKETGEKSGPITRMDMLVNVAQFSKFMGHGIDTQSTTVESYIAIRNLYYKELNRAKK